MKFLIIDDSHNFIVDTLGPTVEIDSIFSNTALPAVTGTTVDSTPGVVVQVLINNIWYEADPFGGLWSAPLVAGQELAEGSYAVIASSTDLQNNPPGNIATGTVVVDLTLPEIAVTNLTEGDSFASTSPVSVSYTASDANLENVACSFDNDLFTDCMADTVFSATLPPGAHYFNLIANDKATNHAEMLVHFTVLP